MFNFVIKHIVIDNNLIIALFFIIFNPIYWNLIARWNYRTNGLTKLFANSNKFACIVLGITILLLGFYRDWRYQLVITSQPHWTLLLCNEVLLFGYLLICCGVLLVLSSYFALGFFGTFLGDYFGIYQPSRVTCFPFNICNNPMYTGSTCIFLGYALIHASFTGLFLSIIMSCVYIIAIRFEGTFTENIYSQIEKLKSN